MTSTITIYKDCLVEQDKNFILDNNGSRAIETYLATLTKETISNFQYIKHRLALSIKIDKNQSALEMGLDSKDYNYCKIQNGSETPCYYFIINKVWKSENTIEYVLAMDTLNTNRYDVDYVVSPKTLVKRMHKDRFKKMQGGEFIFEVAGFQYQPFIENLTNFDIVYGYPKNINFEVLSPNPSAATALIYIKYDSQDRRYIEVSGMALIDGMIQIKVTYEMNALESIIDLRSEEIDVPTYKTSEQTLYESVRGTQNDWSLYYKSGANDNDPIQCFLVPEQTLIINYQASSPKFDANNVPANKYLVFASSYPNGVLTFKYGGTTYSLDHIESSNFESYKLIAVYNDNNTIKVFTASLNDDDRHGYIGQWTQVYTGDLDILNAPNVVYSYETSSLPTATNWYASTLWNPSNASHQTQFGSLTNALLDGHDTIDKTLSENIKIINLPYSPTPYQIDSSGYYTFESCWNYIYNDRQLKLNDFNVKWKNEIDSGINNIISPYIYSLVSKNIALDLSRFIVDSKLLHSDYYRQKFVYDSFSKVFPLEKVSYFSSSKDIDFKFDFIMSRNIVSKFLFKFNQIKYSLSNEDYDNIVAVSRNNEEVLYNSQYINYIRTGYNYDLKAKERQETAGAIGIGLNVASLAASVVMALVPGGQAIGAAGIAASTIGLASQLVNYAKTTAQNEENIQRKLQESQQQGTSVLNADDSDLLYAYSENKAKYCLYKCSPQMERILDDLFFYCGYTINEQMKPAVNTRRSFNYVQASLVIDKTNNLPNEIVDDIKEKFEQGVTFLHYSFGKFDFDQDKENIEKSIL